MTAPALPPGTRLGDRYVLLGATGQMPHAAAYRAKDERFDAVVAVQVAAPEHADRLRKRYAVEARVGHALARVPGIIRALDCGEHEGRPFLVVDLVPGKAPNLRGGPLDARLRIMGRAAGLIERVHECDVAHLDLSPGRFLVTSDGTVHLGGFASARFVAEKADEGAWARGATGSAAYMAPEVREGKVTPGLAADVYSLGVMLHEVLVGRRPDEPGTGGLEQVLQGQPTAQDKQLVGLCRRAISDRPADRPRASELRLALPGQAPRDSARGTKVLAPSKREAPAPPPPAEVRRALGLDPEGFGAWPDLRRARETAGPEALRLALQDALVLVVKDERPLKGVRRYYGKAAPLLKDPAAPAITLGRVAGCGITISLPTVSTSHLVFQRGPDHWTVTDKGSSNGTWIDGQRLEPHQPRPLHDGSVLGLSDHLWLLALGPVGLVEVLGVDAPDGAQALARAGGAGDDTRAFRERFEKAATGGRQTSAFVGAIAGTELSEFLQLVELNGRTGVLHVASAEAAGRVVVREGRVVAADCGALAGQEAVRRLLALRQGGFMFSAREVDPAEVQCDLRISQVLLDAARNLDEGSPSASGAHRPTRRT